MKLGLSIGYSGAEMSLPVERIQLAERLGYDSVWTAEAYGSDALTPLAYLAAITKHIRLGTGILQLAGRTPAAAAMSYATIDALAGGDRVIAGLGVSGPQIVEGWYGQPWGKPYYDFHNDMMVRRGYATRVAANDSFQLRMIKLALNQVQDTQGFSSHIYGAHALHMLSAAGESDPDYALKKPEGRRRPMVQRAMENYERHKEQRDR